MLNNSNAIYTSNSDEWATPQDFYSKLDAEFGFDLDVCATSANHKTDDYFTIEDDGLSKDWGGHKVWCNPPYSAVAKWAKKCYEEGCKPYTTVVMLVPSRTDTRWFQDYCLHRAEIRFVRGRLRFNDSSTNAPFPSMVVIFRGPYAR